MNGIHEGDRKLKVLSLGAGVQSSTVLLMSCRGVLPKLDAAIFADTGWEPRAVYDWLTWLEGEAAKAGIQVIRVTKGNIREDALRSSVRGHVKDGSRAVAMPLYTLNAKTGKQGQIRRQCTKEYKIQPVRRVARELKEKAKAARVQLWMGISGDEMRRMRFSDVRYIEHYYPLIFGLNRPYHRYDCLNWLKDFGYPEAPRSACLGCPYHSEKEWREIKQHPEQWADVVEADEKIRSSGGRRGQTFLHPSCKPLKEIDFESMEDKGQGNWISECEGMCGV